MSSISGYGYVPPPILNYRGLTVFSLFEAPKNILRWFTTIYERMVLFIKINAHKFIQFILRLTLKSHYTFICHVLEITILRIHLLSILHLWEPNVELNFIIHLQEIFKLWNLFFDQTFHKFTKSLFNFSRVWSIRW